MGARTGAQFLAGLRETNRKIWVDGEQIDDVTEHPKLVGAAQSLASMFDRQHQFADECLIPDPETGEPINISHLMPRSHDDDPALRPLIDEMLHGADETQADEQSALFREPRDHVEPGGDGGVGAAQNGAS